MMPCGARTKGSGSPCAREAGWGTPHPGSGRCKLHGGASPGAPVVHGRYSVVLRASLAEKAERFRGDPAPGDLTEELSLLRALLADYLERFGEHHAMGAEDVAFVAALIERIGGMVERINRIFAATALTQAEVQLLEARLADLLLKYVDDADKRLRFLDELGATFDARRARALPAARPGRA